MRHGLLLRPLLQGTLDICLTSTGGMPQMGRRFIDPSCSIVEPTDPTLEHPIGRCQYTGATEDGDTVFPFLWGVPVGTPGTAGQVNLAVAVLSLMCKARDERHGRVRIALAGQILRYAFDGDADPDPAGDLARDPAPLTPEGSYHLLPCLYGDSLDHTGGSQLMATYSIFMSSRIVSSASATSQTAVVSMSENQRAFLSSAFSKTNLRPGSYFVLGGLADPAAFVIDWCLAPPAAALGVDVSAFGLHGPEADVALGGGWSWLDSQWIPDGGTLVVRQVSPSDHIIVNAPEQLRACDPEGWRYTLDFKNKATGTHRPWNEWSKEPLANPLSKVSQVRRRKWFRRITLDSDETTQKPSAAASREVVTTICGPLRLPAKGLEPMLPGYVTVTEKTFTVFHTEPTSVLQMTTQSIQSTQRATSFHSEQRQTSVLELETYRILHCAPVDRARSMDEQHWPFKIEFGIMSGVSSGTNDSQELVFAADTEEAMSQWIATLSAIINDFSSRVTSSSTFSRARTPTANHARDILKSTQSRAPLKFWLVRDPNRAPGFDPTKVVRYLPIVADVQIATWKTIRRVITRFAFAEIPDPRKWRNLQVIKRVVIGVGVPLAMTAGAPVMLALGVGATAFVMLAFAGAVSALGQYILQVQQQVIPFAPHSHMNLSFGTIPPWLPALTSSLLLHT